MSPAVNQPLSLRPQDITTNCPQSLYPTGSSGGNVACERFIDTHPMTFTELPTVTYTDGAISNPNV